jgi:O-antigen ligase
MSSPLTGIGFGRFVEESSTGIEAHNWYANVLAELGVFGLALWMLFVLSVALALRRRPPSARMVGYSVLAAFLVANVFLELPTDKESTAPAFIMLAAACVGDWAAGSRERRQPSEVTQQRSTQPRSTQQRLPGQPSLPRSS